MRISCKERQESLESCGIACETHFRGIHYSADTDTGELT